jgi:hypothetical protein
LTSSPGRPPGLVPDGPASTSAARAPVKSFRASLETVQHGLSVGRFRPKVPWLPRRHLGRNPTRRKNATSLAAKPVIDIAITIVCLDAVRERGVPVLEALGHLFWARSFAGRRENVLIDGVAISSNCSSNKTLELTRYAGNCLGFPEGDWQGGQPRFSMPNFWRSYTPA